MALHYSIVYVCVLIYITSSSSVDGHLGYFCILAIVNRAAMNIEYICLFKLAFLFLFPWFLPCLLLVSVCWIKEKAREFQKNIYFCFIDYAKAFDCVDHN